MRLVCTVGVAACWSGRLHGHTARYQQTVRAFHLELSGERQRRRAAASKATADVTGGMVEVARDATAEPEGTMAGGLASARRPVVCHGSRVRPSTDSGNAGQCGGGWKLRSDGEAGHVGSYRRLLLHLD
uniref:Uncharacterized protein n=1 Tax=Prymnesium polylepis TaxID=72548 RepID=A0A7S4J381_9EUKA